ncbi:MAG: UDP-2,3-diacylglucosamine diphosphatase [Algicola sp.]|nr:UDP-2,3-diacylglucosamine diphosphatase [Algicola sp.]
MPHTLFISDLHLSAERPDMTEAFFTFLRQRINQDTDALYILGDFFEYWIGDDDKTPFHDQVIKALKSVSSKLPVYFIHGNRDFLIGQKFAKQCGMTLLPEQQVIALYGSPALIMHGDSLCTLDLDYMKFRRKSRSKWWQTMILALPLFVRRRIATNARRKSKMAQQGKDSEIMDVTPYEVINQMALNGVDLLIHGHTHRPAIHIIEDTDPLQQRIVLGDWYTQGSYLVCTAQGQELVKM